jgi:hypothetical protein
VGSRDARAFLFESVSSISFKQRKVVEALDVDRDANTAGFGNSVAIEGDLAVFGAPRS